MSLIRGFIAASLDGYIADRDGGIGWLAPFDEVDYGYAGFIADIGRVVMGRGTFDVVTGFESGWPYAGKGGIVVTSTPLANAPAGVEAWHKGVPALIAHLRAREGENAGGDIWLVGGGGLQAAFIEAGALDRLDLFVIPVLLGEGVPLFPRTPAPPRTLTLEASLALDKGMVRLTYTFHRP
ncbi:dihydrofolate reductase [Angulomicrobium tetraedrale]|uniref:Dihydrofolate reductase n=1 Tax=Ancylobacter tetraedralis TaxID=217068 RepID=A0A839ZAV9_9HYPH|nr:dihydrofolate reductase family protein [Ancylobacter tetraedralis]MBB3771842.1 dihydrofolate reductase [Ancylobacter tetraedralis]